MTRPTGRQQAATFAAAAAPKLRADLIDAGARAFVAARYGRAVTVTDSHRADVAPVVDAVLALLDEADR